tara:strand:- start:7664 stop:7963 length:300 start_codon:yes stop_codon:yes gene_type:complete
MNKDLLKFSSEIKERIIHLQKNATHTNIAKVAELSLVQIVLLEILLRNRVCSRFDSQYTKPFRVGRKQRKAVLDATGREVVFFKDSEAQAKMYCQYLNN